MENFNEILQQIHESSITVVHLSEENIYTIEDEGAENTCDLFHSTIFPTKKGTK